MKYLAVIVLCLTGWMYSQQVPNKSALTILTAKASSSISEMILLNQQYDKLYVQRELHAMAGMNTKADNEALKEFAAKHLPLLSAARSLHKQECQALKVPAPTEVWFNVPVTPPANITLQIDALQSMTAKLQSRSGEQ